LFPYSTIGMGGYQGGNEGAAVNITRACRTAEAMADWYRATGREDALEYAVHIADTVRRFQRHDGSLPYRVDPASAGLDAGVPGNHQPLAGRLRGPARESAVRESRQHGHDSAHLLPVSCGSAHSNWYAGNAFAAEVLYRLHDYLKHV
jgi:hypothetical protein